jgi:hypothetical protein
LKAELVLPSDQILLVAEAKLLDAEIKDLISSFRKNISALSKCVCRMKDKNLWKVLIDPETDREFRTWESYAKANMGSISHTKLFNLALIGSLAEGEYAISESTINAIGHTRAAELASVLPEERINLVTSALESTPEQWKTDLQEAKNKYLPPEEQKEATVLFARNYPVSLVARFKDLESRALYMEQFHDADKSISAEAKFLYALVIFFEAGNAEELQAADRRKKAAEKQAIELSEKAKKTA